VVESFVRSRLTKQEEARVGSSWVSSSLVAEGFDGIEFGGLHGGEQPLISRDDRMIVESIMVRTTWWDGCHFAGVVFIGGAEDGSVPIAEVMAAESTCDHSGG